MKFSQLENPFAVIFILVVGPGGQYDIDFFEKCVVFKKLDEESGTDNHKN